MIEYNVIFGYNSQTICCEKTTNASLHAILMYFLSKKIPLLLKFLKKNTFFVFLVCLLLSFFSLFSIWYHAYLHAFSNLLCFWKLTSSETNYESLKSPPFGLLSRNGFIFCRWDPIHPFLAQHHFWTSVTKKLTKIPLDGELDILYVIIKNALLHLKCLRKWRLCVLCSLFIFLVYIINTSLLSIYRFFSHFVT